MIRFASVVQRFGLVLALLVALVPGVFAQQQAPLVGIEPLRASLDQIEAAARRGQSVRALYDLQQTLGPLRDQLRTKLIDLEPRLAEVDARLQGLGPASASEDTSIAAERTRLTQLRGELDTAAKQARLLQARAEQLAVVISDRRRAVYAEMLFERSPSVLDPLFWR